MNVLPQNLDLFQALLANISAMYAVYHGPDGIKDIATTIHKATHLLVRMTRHILNNPVSP